MRRQEATNYRISTEHLQQAGASPWQDAGGYPSELPLYLEWRKKMVEWSYSIASTCKFRQETVEVALSIVDRFVAVQTALLSQAHRYQAACMASLYIAAKIHEHQCLTTRQMECLSAGRFRASDIENMEREILASIQWRVNPPTATAFCRTLLNLMPLELVPDQRTVVDLVESHIQLAIGEEYFLSVDASSLGFASLLNALQCVLGHSNLNEFFGYFAKALLVDGIEPSIYHSSVEMNRLRRKLRVLVVEALASGNILNEAMASAYQDILGGSKGYSSKKGESLYPMHSAESPRSVADAHRSVGVVII